MSDGPAKRGSTKKGSTNSEKAEYVPLGQSVARRRSLQLQQKADAKRSRLDRQAMSPTESLVSAIESFDVDKVAELMKSDFEIVYRHSDHHSVLHFAVAQIDTGTRKIARVLSENPLTRIVEILLDSGRFNVNALDYSCQTPLHLAVEYCSCKLYENDKYRAMVTTIIELLLKNNVNINAMDNVGETPIMRASFRGCSHTVNLLLNWRNKSGEGVDLNARNIRGETALVIAAKRARVDVVELLLKHGCLDNFYDHHGCYAIHAVIYGPEIVTNALSDFLSLFATLAAETTETVLNKYAKHSKIGKLLRVERTVNVAIQRTVSMLVEIGKADINSKDYKGNTVLDVALKSKLRINQETLEKLKGYGASSRHPENSENTLKKYTDKLGKTPLHRLSTALPDLTLRQMLKIFDFKNVLKECKKMTDAKDHKARTILHYAVLSTDRDLSSKDIFTLIDDLKLERIINETDKYGRTPLHYCEKEGIYKSLVKQGANEHIKDNDGKTPRDLKELRKKEHPKHNRPKLCRLDDQQNKPKIDAWEIWKNSENAKSQHFLKQMCNIVKQFMNKLSDEIRKRDPRFECQPVLIGSAEEGTKTGLPDEFDFNFILTKLSELCEVVPSPEAPSGYVHLKRASNNADYGVFNRDGFLSTAEIGCKFRILYLQVLNEPEFWVNDNFFEWDQFNEVGMTYVEKYKKYQDSYEFNPSDHPRSTIQLKLTGPLEDRYMFKLISVDIVPCIKINGWWPEESLSDVNDEIKAAGCHLVFDQPQRNYCWFPFSDSFARISFAPAESKMIKECSAVARAAYMVGKQLIHVHKPNLSYVLKTCLLYCIEALKDSVSSSLLYEDINPTELRLFVEKLMLCFHEFYQQDFLPCYLMPSFQLPIEGVFKFNYHRLLNEPGFEFPSIAYSLYCDVCTTKAPVVYCPPTPDLLKEKFNREELMRKLSMNILEIEYQYPESLAIEEMIQSDTENGSQIELSINRKRRLQRNEDNSKVARLRRNQISD